MNSSFLFKSPGFTDSCIILNKINTKYMDYINNCMYICIHTHNNYDKCMSNLVKDTSFERSKEVCCPL